MDVSDAVAQLRPLPLWGYVLVGLAGLVLLRLVQCTSSRHRAATAMGGIGQPPYARPLSVQEAKARHASWLAEHGRPPDRALSYHEDAAIPAAVDAQAPSDMPVVHKQVVIVGGGAAGLASAATLHKKGIDYIVFEKDATSGYSWARRYDRLHLHTIRDVSALPFIPFPAENPTFPSKSDVYDYLQRYQKELELAVTYRTRVTRAVFDHSDKFWTVDVVTSDVSSSANSEHKTAEEVPAGDATPGVEVQRYRCRVLLVCTGCCPKEAPVVPTFDGLDTFRGPVLHSVNYTNGAQFFGKRVLVVGCGNSGTEIALDLMEHKAKPTLLVRSPVRVVPRWLVAQSEATPWPSFMHDGRVLPLCLHNAVMGIVSWWTMGGMKKFFPMRHFGLMSHIVHTKTPPLLDIGTMAAIKSGRIGALYGEIECFGANYVQLKNSDQRQRFDAVVLATGYDVMGGFAPFLQLEEKYMQELEQRRENMRDYNNVYESVLGGSGHESRIHPQLYFVGFNDFAGLLHEIAREAPLMANNVARQLSALEQ